MKNEISHVNLLYLEYGPKNRSFSLPLVVSRLKLIFPGIALNILIVDNSGECFPDSLFSGQVIPGDNSFKEFSGWQTGYNHLVTNAKLVADGVTCLANDTVGVNYDAGFLTFFYPAEVQGRLKNGYVCGYVDEAPQEFGLLGFQYDRWIRSNFLLIPDRVIQKMGRIMPEVDLGTIFSVGDQLFLPDAKMTSNLQCYIRNWLVTDEAAKKSGQKQWHSARRWDIENYDFLRQKAKMIVLEVVLTQQLMLLSRGIFDVRSSMRRSFGLYWFIRKTGLRRWIRLVWR